MSVYLPNITRFLQPSTPTMRGRGPGFVLTESGDRILLEGLGKMKREKNLAVRDTFILFEGDSITFGATAQTPYPAAAVDGLDIYGWDNEAVSGSSLFHLNQRAAVDDAMVLDRGLSVLFVFIGTNDLYPPSGLSPEDFLDDLKTYVAARRAAGWDKIIVATLLSNLFAGYNTKRNAANVLIRADDTFYDALADFAADPVMGPDNAYSNATLFLDQIHPTTYGHTLLAPIARAAIESVLDPSV
jgi:lysophospholipase L1-like esterase